jgi:hypothetical protein
MIPRLDPKEVAAVFTAPFRTFLRTTWDPTHGPGPVSRSGAPHSWYRGSWTDWHESRWRMHNFYIPRPPASPSPSPPSSTSLQGKEREKAGEEKREGEVKEDEAPPSTHLRTNPTHATTSTCSPNGTNPEGDDPRPEPVPLDDLTTFRVFGMTARILVDAARVAYGEEPQFEHNSHFGDEEMIRGLLKVGRLSEVRRKGEPELSREVLGRAKEAAKM